MSFKTPRPPTPLTHYRDRHTPKRTRISDIYNEMVRLGKIPELNTPSPNGSKTTKTPVRPAVLPVPSSSSASGTPAQCQFDIQNPYHVSQAETFAYIRELQETVKRGNEALPRKIASLRGHLDSVTAVKYHPWKKELISGGKDGRILLWDASVTSKRQHTLRFDGHTGPIYDIAYSSHEGNYIISGSHDQTVRIWVPKINGEVQYIRAHSGPVLAVDCDPFDLEKIVTGSQDKTLKLWDVNSSKPCTLAFPYVTAEQPLSCFTGHTNSINSAKFMSDGKMIVTGSDDKTIRIWDPRIPAATLKVCLTGKVADADFLPMTECYFGGMTQDGFYMYDSRKGDKGLIHSYAGISGEKLNKFRFHPYGDFAACTTNDGSFVIIDLVQGRPIITVLSSKTVKPNYAMYGIDFSSDCTKIAVAGDDKVVQIFDSTLIPYSMDELKECGLISNLEKNEDKPVEMEILEESDEFGEWTGTPC